MNEMPVPAPRLLSSPTRIAKISATTHVPIANCAPAQLKDDDGDGYREGARDQRRDQHGQERLHLVDWARKITP